MNSLKDDRFDIEKFSEYVETIELCGKLIKDNKPATIKAALILTDNLSEILMRSQAIELFERDEFHSQFIRPKYANDIKKRTYSFYEEKIKLFRKEKFLSETDATILRIAHGYRNYAHHLDRHNPASFRVIVPLQFKACMNLFKKVYDAGVMSGGHSNQLAQFKKYGVDSSFIDFKKITQNIHKIHTKYIYVSLPKTKKVLFADICDRFANVGETIEKDIYSPNDELLNQYLRHFELNRLFDHEDASKEFREVKYSIVAGKQVRKEDYAKAEDKYKKLFAGALASFKPTFSAKNIRKFKATSKNVLNTKSTIDLLQRYENIDRRLFKLEVVVNDIALAIDREVQYQIDLKRGK